MKPFSELITIKSRDNIGSSDCRFRIPAETKRALWQITNVCNYKCSYCVFASGPRKILGELDTARALRLVEELATSGFQHLKITGGEPLIRKDLLEILERCGSAGIEFDLSTNASRIDEATARRIAGTSATFIHVSLDGATAGVHDSVRGAGTFNHTVRGIRALVSSGVRVRLGTVVFKDNQRQIEAMVRHAFDLGVYEVIFSFMEPAGRMQRDTTMLTTRSAMELGAELSALRAEFRQRLVISSNFEASPGYACERCPGGARFIYIDNIGRLSPCTWLNDQSGAFRTKDSLREHSLTSLLDSVELRQYRELVTRRAAQGIKGCPLSWSEKC